MVWIYLSLFFVALGVSVIGISRLYITVRDSANKTQYPCYPDEMGAVNKPAPISEKKEITSAKPKLKPARRGPAPA